MHDFNICLTTLNCILDPRSKHSYSSSLFDERQTPLHVFLINKKDTNWKHVRISCEQREGGVS